MTLQSVLKGFPRYHTLRLKGKSVKVVAFRYQDGASTRRVSYKVGDDGTWFLFAVPQTAGGDIVYEVPRGNGHRERAVAEEVKKLLDSKNTLPADPGTP